MTEIEYEPVIGLEVHAQLLTQSKLFCPCGVSESEINASTCPVCLGMPGALPVPNERAIHLAIRAALALGGAVQLRSEFARKHYFYPDLAKGYQISQADRPYCVGGEVPYVFEGQMLRAALVRIHIEEDAAKSVHVTADGESHTVVDFNRAGTPLIEIVGAPVLPTAAHAEAYLRSLREILMFAGVNDGNLEEGSFRCDANVSVRRVGEAELGTRVELKNINSFRFVKNAIDYEVGRQVALLRSGERVVQETRGWDEPAGASYSMRSKEDAPDYRYLPDPDLPVLSLSSEQLASAETELPCSASDYRQRWQSQCGFSAYDAGVLSAHPALASFVDAAVTLYERQEPRSDAMRRGKLVANFIQSEVLTLTRVAGLRATFPVTPEVVVEILALIEEGVINGKIAKEVFAIAAAPNETRRPRQIVAAEGLAQLTDEAAIEAAVTAVLAAHEGQVSEYLAGKETLLGFFVGQVMKKTQGKANPALVQELLRSAIKSRCGIG